MLTEKKSNKETHPKEQKNECIPGPSTQMDQPGPSETQWTQAAKSLKEPKRKGTAPTKRTYKPNKDFDQRSEEAALAQTKLEKARQRQKDKVISPRIHLDTKKLHKDKSVEVINLASDSSQGSPLQIFTSDNPYAFMYAPPNNRQQPNEKRRKSQQDHKKNHQLTQEDTSRSRNRTNHNNHPSININTNWKQHKDTTTH